MTITRKLGNHLLVINNRVDDTEVRNNSLHVMQSLELYTIKLNIISNGSVEHEYAKFCI